jgi:hypothetical protein
MDIFTLIFEWWKKLHDQTKTCKLEAVWKKSKELHDRKKDMWQNFSHGTTTSGNSQFKNKHYFETWF